ncbi:cytochrome b [Paracoccus aerodenitrificans]|uniref:cytochrome b n=1 Tax=Paracoccus aerodenitrificans TaxID=3017781 RepID=UPI0022F07D15|nr:cytochrome b [Paracoccus aerodenitrificans]
MDSPARYGSVTRFFHWTIAVLILWQLASMAVKLWLGRESGLAQFMVGSHASVGFVIFILVWTRLVWALFNLGHRPSHEPGLIGTAAKAGHAVLYLLMLFIPTVAVMRAFGSDRAFTVFGIQLYGGRPEGQEVEALTGAANFHGEAGWLLAVLLVGHVVMAVYHSAVMRDGTMGKMAGAR